MTFIKKAASAAACTLLMSGSLFMSGCVKKPDFGDAVVLTMFTSDLNEDIYFTDPVAKEITRRTGVALELEHPVAGDTNAIPLMLVSGDLPDLIFAKGELTKLIEAGAVIPLDDLIDKYGSNMKKLYGNQIVKLRNSPSDPHIYTVGTYGVKSEVLETGGSMQIQHAVLKELGYPKIKTLADYEQALREYIELHPTINGQKTIGLSLLIDTWQWYIDLSNPGNYTIGYPDDGQWIVNQETLEAQYKFLNKDIYKFYKWLNKINADGLLDPESFTQKEDVWRAKIASGRVLGISYPTWGYGEARSSLINNGMEDRTYAYLPVQADGTTKDPSRKDYGYSGGWGIAISKSCKNPELAFKFLDWMCSEEAQILCNWGIKGINYTVNEDGKRVRSAEEMKAAATDPNYATKTGVGRWCYPFPQAGNAAVDSNGDKITPTSKESIIANYLDVEKETLKAYGAEMWIDLFPSPEELGVSRHGQVWQYALPQNVNEMVTAADQEVKSELALIVLGKPEDFDRQWEALQKKLLDMKLDEAGKILTGLIKEKVYLWNK